MASLRLLSMQNEVFSGRVVVKRKGRQGTFGSNRSEKQAAT